MRKLQADVRIKKRALQEMGMENGAGAIDIEMQRQQIEGSHMTELSYITVVIMYEFEYFSFLFILKVFSAGNVKKNVFIVFIVPIATIGGFLNPNSVEKSSYRDLPPPASQHEYMEYFKDDIRGAFGSKGVFNRIKKHYIGEHYDSGNQGNQNMMKNSNARFGGPNFEIALGNYSYGKEKWTQRQLDSNRRQNLKLKLNPLLILKCELRS